MSDPFEDIDPAECDDVWQCPRHPGRYIGEDDECDTCEEE